MGETLPAAAAGRDDWPIRHDHCFARVILDAVCGRPWREAIRAPAWRRMDEATLERALALGGLILAGEANLVALNRRSLALRGKARAGPAAPRRGAVGEGLPPRAGPR